MGLFDIFKRRDETKKKKTFEDLGLVFRGGSSCRSCRDNSCQNTVTLKSNGNEVHVHISMNKDKTSFKVHASENANTTSEIEIDEDFTNESEAVDFVCNTFNGFKCF